MENSIQRQSIMKTFGARLAGIAPGRVVIEAPIVAGARQQHGFGHAGLTFALGDSAAGYSALTLMAGGAEVSTAKMKINLLAPARGALLRATEEVVRAGRRRVIVRATVCAIVQDKTTEIALLQGTMIPV